MKKTGKEKHVYKPLTAECGAIIVSDCGVPTNFDICVYPKELPNDVPTHTYLNKLCHFVDPMVFPIMFPSGDLGRSTNYKKHSENENDKLTLLQYYLYRLSYRAFIDNFNPLLYAGRLTQQFFIHSYVMIESNRMNVLRNNQTTLRIECYKGLLDNVMNSASNITENFTKNKIGNLFVLPSTYIGGPRYMQKHYQDAMAIMRKHGRPDLFVTVTCNPKWKELKQVLKHFPKNTTRNDIPNITVGLFHTKFQSILKDISKNKSLYNRISKKRFIACSSFNNITS